LTPRGTPVTRAAAWWDEMALHCGEAVDEAGLEPDELERVFAALDKIERACEGRDGDDAVTVTFSSGEKRLLDEGGWLDEVPR
jgi:hypothetical protein